MMQIASHRLNTIVRHLVPSVSPARHLTSQCQRTSIDTRRYWNTTNSRQLTPITTASATARSFSTFTTNTLPLPPQSERDRGRLTVVLDMDETLLHSFLSPLPVHTLDPRSVHDHEDEAAAHIVDKKPFDHEFVIGELGDADYVRTICRPGMKEFLYALSQEFEPILFTSATQLYAEPLLDRIDPKPSSTIDTAAATPAHLHPLWRHRLYRPSTRTLGKFTYVKDISRLGRPMERIVLIDNSWAACVANPDNCLIVPDYLGAKTDTVFEQVLALLRAIKDEKDVRPTLIKMLRFREQIEKAGIKLPA